MNRFLDLLRLIWILGLLFAFSMITALNIQGQTEEKVCISATAARNCLANADLVEAQKKQIALLEQAIADLKNVNQSLQIEVAKLTGEKTGLEKNAVRDAAIIEMLLQNVKKKRTALITLF